MIGEREGFTPISKSEHGPRYRYGESITRAPRADAQRLSAPTMNFNVNSSGNPLARFTSGTSVTGATSHSSRGWIGAWGAAMLVTAAVSYYISAGSLTAMIIATGGMAAAPFVLAGFIYLAQGRHRR